MTMMPIQPSMMESWSFADLRCKVHERERERANAARNDRPLFDPGEKGRVRFVSKGRAVRAARARWASMIIGSCSVIAGGLWLLTILGFDVPWFTALPMALMFAGSFIIASSLNQRTASEMISHDRCDH